MTIIYSGREPKAAVRYSRPPVGTIRRSGPGPSLLSLYGNRAATYEAMIFAQPWLYACVRTFVIAIARTPANSYSGGNTENDRKRERAHALPRLLKRPYPLGNRFQLFADIAYDIFGPGGFALIMKSTESGGRVPAGEEPDELWPIPARYVQIERDDRGILGFNVTIGGKSTPLLPSDVIYIPHPMGGRSPIAPLERTAALEEAAIDWQRNTLENDATPTGAFFTEKLLKDDTISRLREELAGLYAGPENRRFGLFDQGLDFKAISNNAVNVELINQRKLSREEVAGAYGIPAPMIGILDHATYSNISELRRSFYVDTIAPYLTLIEDCFDSQLIAPIRAWDGLYIEFDMHEILKPDPEAEARTLMINFQSSTLTTNERRKRLNLSPIGDPSDPDNPHNQIWYPANMLLPGATAEDRQAATLSAFLAPSTNALNDSLAAAAARMDADPLAVAFDGTTNQEG